MEERTITLKYIGDETGESFKENNLYEAIKYCEEDREYYAIYDEGEDWYCYSVKFVEANFEMIEKDDKK